MTLGSDRGGGLGRRPVLKLACIAFATALAAGCGSRAAGHPHSAEGAKRGGVLEVLAAGDFQTLDPGQASAQFDDMVVFATQRALYGWKPRSVGAPEPDLAAGPPRISSAGRVVTVRLRRGVRFSPPVDREVTAADVKYAIERAATPNVTSPYFATYFDDLVGAAAFQRRRAKEIAGIETPDPHTLVFRLRRPTGAILAQALSLPMTAPVPREYAARYDAASPSSYARHMVFTGPYVVSSYEPGREAVLTRNPNWDERTDWRPAYADRIEIRLGNDVRVASRAILEGNRKLSGDFAAPPALLERASDERRSQIVTAHGAGTLFASLNTRIPPLDDVNVRRAIVAAVDREALRLTRGGASAGAIATHYLFPGMPGFEEAGGERGPGFDFLSHPRGSLALARAYMRRAGYPSGRYTGHARLLMVAQSEHPGDRMAEAVRERLAQLGLDVTLREVPAATMYSKFCGVPKARVAICPNLGWLKDFYDPQTVLDPLFNGRHVLPVSNTNYSQLDDPALNRAIARAELLASPRARAEAWGEIDRMASARAVGIPWLWPDQANMRSADVNGVVNRFTGSWDLSFSSLRDP
ncbi:MAG: hypothetical protein IRZ21_07845 [Thermoleophilaceae bacterium]|nr:hypothetical protein [Thermoleophilaceae bacterium]